VTHSLSRPLAPGKKCTVFAHKRGAKARRRDHNRKIRPSMRAPFQDVPGYAPFTEASVRRCLDRLCKASVGAYRRELAACRRRLSRRSIHELRIAIRRLVICLRLLGAAQRAPAGVRSLLLLQLKALGEVRDTQVQLKLIEKGPLRGDAALEPLRGHLRRRKHRRVKVARRALESDKALRRLQRWHPHLEGRDTRIIPRLRRLIDGMLREALDSLAFISGSARADPAAWHRTRVLSRECCYVVEALRPCWRGGRTEELLSILRACQQGVGQIRDRELLRRRIGRLVGDGGLEAEPTRRLGAMLQSEKARWMKSFSLGDWRRSLEALLARREISPGRTRRVPAGNFHRWPGR
jgi:CHAD domain-containing protein